MKFGSLLFGMSYFQSPFPLDGGRRRGATHVKQSLLQGFCPLCTKPSVAWILTDPGFIYTIFPLLT